jgi:imidazolonepropionase-like amidohydrolase
MRGCLRTDTRDLTRFTLVGDKGPDLDLASAPVREFIQLLAQRKTVIDPTLGGFEDMFVGQPGRVTPGLETLVQRLPVSAARSFLVSGLPGDHEARYRAAFEKMLALIKTLYDAKITLVVGTDWFAGLTVHHELELYARAGIPNADVLRMATVTAARSSGLAERVGVIAPGKRADLAVIDGDPLANIADIERVVSTVRAGVVFDSAAVYRTVSVQPLAVSGR